MECQNEHDRPAALGGLIASMIAYRSWIPWAVLALSVLNIPTVTNGYRLTALGLPSLDEIISIGALTEAAQYYVVPILFSLIALQVVTTILSQILWHIDFKSSQPSMPTFVERIEMPGGKSKALVSGVSAAAHLVGQLCAIALLAANLVYPVIDFMPSETSNFFLMLQAFVCGIYIVYVFVSDIVFTLYRKPYDQLHRFSEEIDARSAERRARNQEEYLRHKDAKN